MDPLLSLAFSMHSNPGVYALLLGSGLSRSAGIPTGWEVVQDLIRKLASLKGEDPGTSPETWFQREFGQVPDYSQLLELLAPSPAERRQLLESYFEPNAEEREQGLKTPTPGHRAIAELMSEGLVKVVVTTNFDRLVEKALEEIGISPVVISTPDAVKGAPPLPHVRCALIKIHGDYLDARIRNSPRELERYDVEMDKLLDTVFDNYGIVVCGWSADWDTALRTGLERSQSRRYTLYWAHVRPPGPLAERLITLKHGQKIATADSDTFFADLTEKTTALRSLTARHPLSRSMAVQTVKKYLSDSRHIMRLTELITDEAIRVRKRMADIRLDHPEPTGEQVLDRMQQYEDMTADLVALLSVGCYWGQDMHHRVWTSVLQMLVPESISQGDPIWIAMQRYAVVVCFYAAGIGAVGGEQYETLSALFTRPRASFQGHNEPFAASMFAWATVEPYMIAEREIVFSGLEESWCPFSERLELALRPALLEVLPANFPFTWCFDRFELMTVLGIRAFSEVTSLDIALLFRTSDGERPPKHIAHLQAAVRELKAQQERWPPFRMGFLPQTDEESTGVEKLTSFIETWEEATTAHSGYWSGRPVREFYTSSSRRPLHD
jgi:hypothetical protein